MRLSVVIGHSDIIKEILNYGANLENRDLVNRTVLHVCCRAGDLNNLLILIEAIERKGLRDLLNARSAGGVTPLMAAVQTGKPELVRLCLDKGMDPKHKDYTGKTCLDYAA